MASKEHQQLAGFIKSVHQGLRAKSRVEGADEAWQQHCQNTEVLQEYAEKMKILATDFWQNNNCEDSNICRIQWVVKQSVDYFHADGYKKALEKEDNCSKRLFGKPLAEQLVPKGSVPVLKLLDVGSCYNPFSKFPIFDVVALDLMPATPDVIKCDFLSVVISKDDEQIQNPSFLLVENSFEVVVFSLLLEYFPSSKQRLKCCENAYKVLKPGGLLFILTPDSKHATANSKMMKSWRYALASLGFWRVTYQKLKHLHCMAYRKCFNPDVPTHLLNLKDCTDHPEDMLYIPQDFNDHCDVISDAEVVERSETDNKLLVDVFYNLPDTDVFK